MQLPEAQLFIWSSADWTDDKLTLLRFSENETSSTYSHIPKLWQNPFQNIDHYEEQNWVKFGPLGDPTFKRGASPKK